MTYPTPPGAGDQSTPPPDPLYQQPIEAYQPPPEAGYQRPPDPLAPGPAYPPAGAFPPAGAAFPPPPVQAYSQPPVQAYGMPAYQYGYPDPYGYSPYPPRRTTDGMAIASLIVSCVALPAICLYGFTGLVGIVGAILGHVARRRIRNTDAPGAGIALAGIIVGWIAAGIGVLAGVGLILLIINSGAFDGDTTT